LEDKIRRKILICTVGTSLFEGNLKKISDSNFKDKPQLKQIKENFENKNWKKLAKSFQKIDPLDRICGAEINTIQESLIKNWLSLEKIYFLVSDTEDGQNTGKFLKEYFVERKDLRLKEDAIIVKVVKDLQDKDPKKFKLNGLKNLIKEIIEIVSRNNQENIAIDATGGYKAQIALAVIIGQALDIPVYYKHERFSEIIDFTPLPISLDYDLLGKYSDIFHFLKEDGIIDKEQINFDNIEDRKLSLLLEEVEIDGKTYLGLNPIGYLYLSAFELRCSKDVDLPECKIEERVNPKFKDDHYPKGFKEFVEKVWKQNNWIKTCIAIDYDKQKSIKSTGFYLSDDSDEKKLIGTYIDKDKFKARFRIFISKESMENLNWAAYYLNEKYGE